VNPVDGRLSGGYGAGVTDSPLHSVPRDAS